MLATCAVRVPPARTRPPARRRRATRTAAQVREGVAAWQAAGVSTPVIVPSSTAGGQLKALEEIFATFG